MKKLIASFLVSVMLLCLSACGRDAKNGNMGSKPLSDIKGDGVMSYDEYSVAGLDTDIVIETYVQDKQIWNNGVVSVYTQDKDGAYFLYRLHCSEGDYAKLIAGQKLKVTGIKKEMAGEAAVCDASFSFEDGSFIAAKADATSLLGTDELIRHQNEAVSFKGLTIEGWEDGSAFYYNRDNSGQSGSNCDLYFNASINGHSYTFVVESSLRDQNTDVYKTVEGLKVGDIVDLEGFLYWYDGPQPHITSVTVR